MSAVGSARLAWCRRLIPTGRCAYVEGTDGLKLTMFAEKFGGDFQLDMHVLQSVPGRHSRQEFLRPPRGTDAIGIRDLAAATEVLDLNSTYAYLLLATDFAATSIVAERDGDLHGFITGYHPPPRPDVLFVWQVAVAPSAQGGGLASTMLDALVHRVRSQRDGRPVTVEATVAPGNTASRAFFGAFARRHGVPLVEDPHFGSELLDAGGAHEDEPILRMGPIATPLSR